MVILILAIIVLILAILVSLFALSWLILLLKYKAPYVKTPRSAIDTILQQVAIKPDELVVDLGCGDGDVLIAIEKKYSCKTIGYEASPFPYLRAWHNVRRSKIKTKIYWRSFFKANLADTDVVFCFLIESLMPRVGVYLQSQLKPGARVICYGYPIPEWSPTQTIDVPGTTSKIHIYQH